MIVVCGFRQDLYGWNEGAIVRIGCCGGVVESSEGDGQLQRRAKRGRASLIYDF